MSLPKIASTKEKYRQVASWLISNSVNQTLVGFRMQAMIIDIAMNIDLSHEYTELSHEYTELSHEYTELSSEYTDLSRNITDLHHEYTDLSHNITDLHHEYTDLSHQRLAGVSSVHVQMWLIPDCFSLGGTHRAGHKTRDLSAYSLDKTVHVPCQIME